MAESTQPEVSATAASFKEHVEAFHQSLPREEQVLLEQVFALAQAAEGDVQGFAIDNFIFLPPIYTPPPPLLKR
jgi:hypothetical protein